VSSERQKVQAEDASFHRPPLPSSGDLLDLVRSAEEQARLAIRKRTPAVPMTPVYPPSQLYAASEEEFVDVGDEAIDAPPSLPPGRSSTPGAAFTSNGPRSSRNPGVAPLAASSTHAPGRGLRPAVAIVLMLVVASAVLALLVR
jgi:hypothetical protein